MEPVIVNFDPQHPTILKLLKGVKTSVVHKLVGHAQAWTDKQLAECANFAHGFTVREPRQQTSFKAHYQLCNIVQSPNGGVCLR